jgi:hypothetical protein
MPARLTVALFRTAIRAAGELLVSAFGPRGGEIVGASPTACLCIKKPRCFGPERQAAAVSRAAAAGFTRKL